MKKGLIIIALITAYAGVVACQRQEADVLKPTGMPIPITLEQPSETKVDIAATTGVCTWTDGDEIGLWVTGGANDGYREGTVDATTETVSPITALSGSEILGGFAIYPYIMRGTGSGPTPTVNYLTSYSMEGVDLTEQTYSLVPMMAVGSNEYLHFYHVGAMIRMALSNVPENTNKIIVTFEGVSNVTGTATVSNPGTKEASTTITSGTGNVITFTDVNRNASKLYLNIPIATGNYSDLSVVWIECYQGNTFLGRSKRDVNAPWGILKHAHGRVFAMDVTPQTSIYGGNGKFRNFYVSPGFLYLNGDEYAFTENPFDMVLQYANPDAIGKYYFKFRGTSSLKYLQDGTTSTSGVIVNNNFTVGGQTWMIPTHEQAQTIFNSNPNQYGGQVRVNGANVSYGLAGVVVSLDGSEYSGKGLTSWSGSGTEFNPVAEGNITRDDFSGTNYQSGILLIPDGAQIFCPRLTNSLRTTYDKNNITLEDLQILIEGGCIFFPTVGRYIPPGISPTYWGMGGTYLSTLNNSIQSGYVRTSVFYSGTYSYTSAFDENCLPLFLIR